MVEKILTDSKSIARRVDETAILNTPELKVVEKPETQKVALRNVTWNIDPIQSYLMNIKAQKMPAFAEALNRNMTGLFFRFLDYKVEHREVITLECKGQVRSGKSTGGISICKYISSRTGVVFLVDNICPNEQYYNQSIRDAVDNQCLLIDEQLEQHTGLGAFREMQHTEDLGNVIAKRCLTGDTKIILSSGEHKKIEDIVGTKQKVLSFNFDNQCYECNDAVVFSTGVDDVYEVTTSRGKVFYATLDHEMFTITTEGIKKIEVKDIKEGDYIASTDFE